MKFVAPEPMRLEHEALHRDLQAAAAAGGEVGDTARLLAGTLRAHTAREELVVMPALSLLGPLSRGEFRVEMADVLPLTDALRDELPRMLDEHEAVRSVALRLATAARAAGRDDVARFADGLVRHLRVEEEILYPAALLVGTRVRAALAARPR